jgi:hypothetical protein
MPAPRSSRGRRGPLAGSRGGPGVTVNEALGSGSGGEGEGAVSSVLVHLPPQPTHGDDGRRPWNAGPPPPRQRQRRPETQGAEAAWRRCETSRRRCRTGWGQHSCGCPHPPGARRRPWRWRSRWGRREQISLHGSREGARVGVMESGRREERRSGDGLGWGGWSRESLLRRVQQREGRGSLSRPPLS